MRTRIRLLLLLLYYHFQLAIKAEPGEGAGELSGLLMCSPEQRIRIQMRLQLDLLEWRGVRAEL